jgi:plastocyanin
VQVSGIFSAAGVAGTVTDNAVIVVSAATQVFSYAAVIDNNTTDPIFVVGAEDNPVQAFTPQVTSTPSQSTPTPTPPSPTVTPTPGTGGVQNVNVGSGGNRFVDSVSGDSTTTITRGTTVHWIFNGFHSTTSQNGSAEQWDSGEHSSGFTFDRQFNNPGSFPYFCTVHGLMMSGTVVVN